MRRLAGLSSNLRVECMQLRGEASCRFTDDLELSDRAILEELTLKKSRLIDIDQVILGLRNGIPNMLQIQSIIRFFHRAIRLPL